MIMNLKQHDIMNESHNRLSLLDDSMRKLLIFIPDAEHISLVDFRQLVQLNRIKQDQINFLLSCQIPEARRGIDSSDVLSQYISRKCLMCHW